MRSRRQILLARVNWYLPPSLKTLLNKSRVIDFIKEVVVTDRFFTVSRFPTSTERASAVPSLTPRQSKLQVFQQTRVAQNFSKPYKKHHIYYWVFRLSFHSWFIWYPLDISRAFERTTYMTISSTLKPTNTLPYAWKYHRIDSTELIKMGGLTSSTQQRSTRVQYFRTKILQGVILQKQA